MPLIGLTASASSNGFGRNASAPPIWLTAAGSLGSDYTGRVSSFTAAAQGATTYTVISGTLATGHSLNTATGVITGTASGPADYSSSTYNVTIRAINGSGSVDRSFSYTIASRFVGYVCATAGENDSLTITAPTGMVFNRRDFSSYGTPGGTCGAFTIGGCNSVSSNSWNGPIGLNSITTFAQNGLWGDPCSGTFKAMAIQFTYGPF
jgi:hypothetical protein